MLFGTSTISGLLYARYKHIYNPFIRLCKKQLSILMVALVRQVFSKYQKIGM